MNFINDVLTEITSRLPELEWKVNRISSFLPSQSIPKNLFRFPHELTGVICIEEIKRDIQILSSLDNERSAYYLANKIKQKITVLVFLCQLESKKNKSEEKNYFGLKMLSTRKQRIQNIEQEINILEKQQAAMSNALNQMNKALQPQAILSLQRELGEVERLLTLAKEALNFLL